MKNVKYIKLDITEQLVVVCLNHKAYYKYLDKYNITEPITKDGICLRISNDEGVIYIISVSDSDKHDLINIKALWVHEISHLTTMLMEDSGIVDDEYRSTLIQYIYTKVMHMVDKKYFK